MQNGHENIIHKLKGFSGSSLRILRKADISFVRKTAQTPRQNSKLIGEVEKLNKLADLAKITELFQVPTLLYQGIDNQNKAFYDTEFIPGWQLDFFINQLNPKEIDLVSGQICEIIKSFKNLPEISNNASVKEQNQSLDGIEFIRSKFKESLKELTNVKKDYPELKEIISEFEARISDLKITNDLHVDFSSFCHGDLALDNIMISRDRNLYLIDPLINGFESYMWDISKLFQSSLILWRQIKIGEFEVDTTQRKVYIKSSNRMTILNNRFYEQLIVDDNNSNTVLYLAATLARTAKYWQTYDQLAALLIVTNELLERFSTRRYELDEPLNSMRW